MIINHNLMAMNTHRQMGAIGSAQSKSTEKLSSGMRINRAGDDAAGLAISEKMRGQIRGLNQASRNAQDGISLIQTAEGALNETQAILQRMRELAVQSSNDTNADIDRTAIQNEISQLTSEIDRIGNTTEFNTKKLLNGGANVSATVADGDANGESKFITNISGTGDTKAGSSIKIATSTLATAKLSTDNDAFASNVVAAGGISFTINGTAFSFAAGETDQNVIDTINDAGLGVVASINGNGLEILTDVVGSAAVLDVTGSLAAATGGDDAKITEGTTAGTTFSNYSAVGNTITIEDGNAKGLTFEVTGVLTDTATDGTDDTTISVTSNGTLSFQIGANAGQDMNVGIVDMRADALGVQGVDVLNTTTAKAAITTIQKAVDKVSAERAKLGAVQNRLEHSIKNLDTSSENLQAAESRIRDVDMAKEMMEFTKNNILQQAAQSMLAQANQAPQGVLQLLR